MEENEFKTCPFCKEKIRFTAVKCRFCGEWLEQATTTEATVELSVQNQEITSDKTKKISADETQMAEMQPSQEDLMLGEKVFRDLEKSLNICPWQEAWELEFLTRKNPTTPIQPQVLEKLWSASNDSGRKLLPTNTKQSPEELQKRPTEKLSFWEAVFTALYGVLGLLGLFFVWIQASRFKSDGYLIKAKESWRLFWLVFGIKIVVMLVLIWIAIATSGHAH